MSTEARQIESTGNILSGLGEHGLATRLWDVAARLRRRQHPSLAREIEAVNRREAESNGR